MTTIEWRCKQSMPHPSCESTDWRHYQDMTEKEAAEFMEHKAARSTHFEYRVKPKETYEAIIQNH